MTDLNNQGGAEGVIETPIETPQPTPAEQQARDLGWTPEEEWDGPPDSWLPADEYLKKEGRTATKLKRSEGRVKQLETEVASFNERLERMERVKQTTIQRERERIEREFETRIEEMTERGDVKGVKQALKDQKTELEKLEEKEEGTKPAGDVPRLSRPDQEAFEDFLQTNAWFQQDQILNAAMNRYWDDVVREMPAASMEVTLAEARRRVARKFPEEFGQKRGESAPNRVESGGRNLNGSGGGTYWSKVPAADRAQAEQDMKDYPKAFKSKEDWARAYFDVKD